MDDLKDELRDGLERIAAAGSPATTVDAAAAVRRGRRVRRARRSAAAVIVAAAVGTGAAAAVLPGGGGENGVVQATGYPSPLTAEAAFGWLPRGYGQTGASGGDDGETEPVFLLKAGTDRKPKAVELTLYAPGTEAMPKVPKKGWRSVELVDGRVAYWTVEPGGSGEDAAELSWQNRQGRWVVLSIGDRGIADSATVLRIAAGVRFQDEPAAFPVRVTGVPGGLEVLGASVTRRPQGVEFDLGHRTTPGDPRMPNDYLRLEIRPADAGDRRFYGTNTTVDGDPAQDSRLPHSGPDLDVDGGGQRLIVFDAEGRRVRIEAAGRTLERLQAAGGLAGLYRRITFLGSDPGKWTTRPLA
ncbi:hypothetical protein [Actinomadura fibrosa]|uniref:Uncharacterized protein n=1 Tax=Actinomadura fibrosa TaxID=111802 RepID=A0ABW2Y281_9ACTN|nr:hypothetical protein [Actinomadura fibrosa]